MNVPNPEGNRLSPQQLRLWRLQQQGGPYLSLCALQIEGKIAPSDVRKSLQELAARHQILRTAFRRPDGPDSDPLQVVASESNPDFQQADWTGLPPPRQQERLGELLSRFRRRPFDLENSPLLKARLIALSVDQHILLLRLPSLCCDAWTLRHLLEQISTQSPAPDEILQYSQFAHWQHGLAEDEFAAQAGEFWKRHGPDPSRLRIPFQQGTSSDSFTVEILAARLEPALESALASAVRQAEVSRQAFLLAVWQALLWRLGEQSEVVTGAALDGREFELLRSGLGLYSRWLPVRNRLTADFEVENLARRIHDFLAEAAEWQGYFRWEGDSFENDQTVPCFAAGFEYERRFGQFSAKGCTFRLIHQFCCTERFEIKLACLLQDDRLSLELHFDPSLLRPADALRLLGGFEALLQSALDDPHQSVGALNLLQVAERHQILVEWGCSEVRLDARSSLLDLFEEQTILRPHALAVASDSHQLSAHLSYGQLERRSRLLGRFLQKLGLGPEGKAGILMERSAEMLAAILAAVRAGGAYLPLDPAYPPERLAFMLEDAQALCVLTQPSLQDRLPSLACPLICPHRNWPQIASQSGSDRLGEPLQPENLAYLIYTSGSTGRPKGVAVTHGSLLNLVEWHRSEYLLTPVDRASQLAGPGFDASVWEVWPYWTSGAALIIASEETRLSPQGLRDWLLWQQVTISFVPTPLMEGLLLLDWEGGGESEEGERGNNRRGRGGETQRGAEKRTALRAALTGGDRLMQAPDQPLPFELVNHYGPAESTVVSTAGRVQPGQDGPPPIGRPIANIDAVVTDRWGNPLPTGIAGQLLVGGRGLARGYAASARQTAELFRPHPFRVGQRLYQTGDRVRWRGDGQLEFLGRIDQQVKMRGFRIELGEIEAVLGAHPVVQACAVLAPQVRPGERRLVAYASDPDGLTSPAELQAFLREQLPEFMLPSAFILLPELPLTANGKVDRRALPQQATPEDSAEYIAPVTATQELLASFFAGVLELERVGIGDSFFERGGHSLLATQVISRINKAFGIDLPVRTLFEAPTVEELAQAVDHHRRQSRAEAPALRRVARGSSHPLSFAQQRLWFIIRLEGALAAYNTPSAARLMGPLDAAALQRALSEIVRRHEVLRTTFALVDGEPRQIVQPAALLPLPLIDLSALAEKRRLAEAERLAADEARRPYSLEKDWMLRASLMRLGHNDHGLLVTLHHIVSDAWSMGILTRELTTLYGRGSGFQVPGSGFQSPESGIWYLKPGARSPEPGTSAASPSLLPPLPYQYADFAAWQREWLQGKVLQGQLDYWRGQLEGLPSLDLPTDRPRPPQRSYQGGQVGFALDAAHMNRLRQLAGQAEATPFMAFLTAFATLLHRYRGQKDLAIGVPIANRNQQGVESLIGFFVNTLVMRLDLSGDPTAQKALERVRRVCLEAYDHQDVPFEQIVEELHPERDLAKNPLIQMTLAYQNAPDSGLKLQGLELAPLSAPIELARFDLEGHLWEASGGLNGSLIFSRDLFDATTVRRLVLHLRTLLEGMTAQPDQPISRLPWISRSERHQVVQAFNDTDSAFPRWATIGQLFEVQADKRPDAVAMAAESVVSCQLSVVSSEREPRASASGTYSLQPTAYSLPSQLSYAALEKRSNQLARHLQSLGVGPDVLVGLCLERSLEMAVALLGILKAGGAYLPLDPKDPGQRLVQLLEDAYAPVLLAGSAQSDRLPSLMAQLVSLDSDWGQFEVYPAERPPGAPASLRAVPESLAYVLYTSGSTGLPKGVAVSHRSVVRLVRDADYARFGPEEVFLQLAPLAFDASTLELWGSLLHGARLALMPPEVPTLQQLGRAIRRHQVSTLWLTAGLFQLMVSDELESLKGVRQLLAGGDVLPVESVRRVLDERPGCQLINGYGPTENTTFSCCYRIPTDEARSVTVPIGRPISASRAYLLDGWLAPVPVGVSGELCASGEGVARGYWGRPSLTAERFVPDPFSSTPGGRLYRTGDRTRWLADGRIEFLGRWDDQVKVRGFRVELGEVQAALESIPGVAEAVVAVRQEPSGQRRLIAYAVPEALESVRQLPSGKGARKHVGDWQRLYEDLYRQPASDEQLNLAGWNSSYTGRPIPQEEMRQWVSGTVEGIRALKPERILEIGCGTGLLLLRLAPDCREYWATDFSQQAIRQIERLKGNRHELQSVQLRRQAADDFQGIPAGHFDTVILNSVVQYFPGVGYLVQVIEGALRCLRPGGRLFIGDVRSLPLLRAYHASVELFQASASLTLLQLAQRVEQRISREEELVVDPAFFSALPGRWQHSGHTPCVPTGVASVEVRPQKGEHANELTRFRYEAILRTRDGDLEEADDLPQAEWLNWQSDSLTLPELRRRLEEGRPGLLGVREIPNKRLWEENETLSWLSRTSDAETVGQLRRRLSRIEDRGVDPEELWGWDRELPYRIHLSWASASPQGCFDALFVPHSLSEHTAARILHSPHPERPWAEYASNPLQERLARQLAPIWRQALEERLPEYMLPSALVVLSRLPLTPSGKVDRRALPEPQESAQAEGYRAPRRPVEEILAGIWAEVLGLERVGLDDNFFDLGGHSLLATQVITRIGRAFGFELPLRALFEAPTLAGLAMRIQNAQQEDRSRPAPPIRPAPRDQDLPLSFAQQRLWFLDQLDPGQAVYNVPVALRLHGNLDIASLHASLDAVLQRHQSLRTRFQISQGVPCQIIEEMRLQMPLADLQALPQESRSQELSRWLDAQSVRPFDLSQAPMLRTLLLRLDKEDHVLAATMHHIASDGWSMGIFTRELSALYGERRSQESGIRNQEDGRGRELAAGSPEKEPETRSPESETSFSETLQPHSLTASQPSSPTSSLQPPASSLLPPLPIQYADFALWQRSWLSGAVLDELLQYWKETLSEVPRLELPTDRPRAAAASFRGSTIAVVWPKRLRQALQQLSRSQDATLFMSLLAAYGALLARYTGQTDFCLGTPIANRNRSETEGLIGFFINMLALRVRPAEGSDFLNLVSQLRETALGAFAHQDLPFEQLVDALAPQRSLNQAPLFQTLFQLQNAPLPPLQLEGLQVSLLASKAPISEFDLSLSLMESGGGLAGELEYSTDLFDRTTMLRLLGHLRHLLEGVADDPKRPLLDCPLASQAERHQIVTEWGDRPGLCSRPEWIGQRFEEVADSKGDAAGLVDGSHHLSYGEWRRQAEAVALWLRHRGAGPEVCVALCLERSLSMLTGLMGIVLCGAGYLPLDPDSPQQRLQGLMQDAGTSFLVTRSGLLAKLGDRIPALLMDSAYPFRSLNDLPLVQVSLLNTAYWIYTSGTTGKPKAVTVTHTALACYTQSWIQALNLQPGQRFLQFSSISFDQSCEEIYPCLASAGTLVLRDPAMLDSAQSFVEACRREALTTLSLPTAYWHQIDALDLPTSLDTLIIGGERAQGGKLCQWLDNAPPSICLINGYGPTEATVAAAAGRVDSHDLRWRQEASLGRPLGHVSIHLLDPRLRHVPVGLPGELCIGGQGLARGYQGWPAQTAARFIPDPFSRRSGSRLYRTGDLAARLPDGRPLFRGRIDDQVKLRGYRVEPGEVEALLATSPAVSACAVLVVEGRLVAYVVGRGGEREREGDNRRGRRGRAQRGAEKSSLRPLRPHSAPSAVSPPLLSSFLRQRLPNYMVPSDFVFLDQMPLTPSAKIDRKALMKEPIPEASAQLAEPLSPVESLLAGIWSEVLGAERIGKQDSFFDLGGHSLLATQAVSRVRRAFGVEIPLRTFFETPTLQALSRRIELARRTNLDAGIPPLVPQPRPPQVPLSFAQQRLWFLDQMDPGNAFFNIPGGLRLRGELDFAALQSALNQIVGRHESLRTRFPVRDGQPFQVIEFPSPVPIPLIDLTSCSPSQREAELRRLQAEEAVRPFDLARGPLLRVRLVQIGEQSKVQGPRSKVQSSRSEVEGSRFQVPGSGFQNPESGIWKLKPGARSPEPGTLPSAHSSVLLLTMHHIISDGWSMGILIRELAEGYQRSQESGVRSQEDPGSENCQLPTANCQLSPLPIQYADYAIWQRKWLRGDALRGQLEYWKEALQGSEALDLPTDRPHPARPDYQGAVEAFAWPESWTGQLRALARRQDATLFMILVALLQVLLGRLSGQQDVSLGSPIANRNQSETENLIGFFLNTLVLRSRFGDNPTFSRLLNRVRRVALDAYAHQDVPFEQVVDALQLQRSVQRTPLFQVLLILQNTPEEELHLPGLEVSVTGPETTAAKFDLTFMLTEEGGGLNGAVIYRAGLFDACTVRRLLQHFGLLAQAALADPEQKVLDLPMMNAAQRQQVLAEWSSISSSASRPGLVHSWFEEHSDRRPDSVALDGDATGIQLSYRNLDRLAEQTARLLHSQGAGPEVVVGLCLPRSPQMVMALLAVFKSGSAFLALDPDQPEARLSWLIRQSRMRLLLTHSSRRQRLESLPGQEIATICLDRISDMPDLAQGGVRAALPENLAYITYTSGSTGKPKGICTLHRSAAHYLKDLVATNRLHGGDVMLQLASLTFDAAIKDLMGTLSAGARLVVPRDDQARDPEAVLGLMHSHGVSRILSIVPTVLRALLDALQTTGKMPVSLSRVDRTGLPSLRTVLISGERLLRQDCRRIANHLGPQVQAVNLFGPTECTITASRYAVPSWPSARFISAGRPISGTQFFVLDRQLNPVALGAVGELFIAGSGLARGYLGKPSLTACTLLPNPFVTDDRSARLYRSGDKVRWRSDGQMEFLGRLDRQVKIRGLRIEPGEAESVLAEHPLVRECAVVVAGEALAAFVVGRERAGEGEGDNRRERRGGTQRVAEKSSRRSPRLLSASSAVSPRLLRSHLQAQLPDYLLPSTIQLLDDLPRTPNGKVDRRALSALQPIVERADSPLPSTPLEKHLARIWQQVLKVDQLRLGDSFFELGGHSLLATQVISRIRQDLDVDLPLRTLFEAPTLQALAQRLQSRRQTGRPTAPPLLAWPERRNLPLSYAQRRLWFLQQLDPTSTLYNIHSALNFEGALDMAALQAALGEITRRHETLRTCFPQQKGEPRQRILSWKAVPLPLIDLSRCPKPLRTQEARRLSAQQAERLFDLDQGPLLRVGLVMLRGEEETGDRNPESGRKDSRNLRPKSLSAGFRTPVSGLRSSILLLTLHHIISDGWSMGILRRELEALYGQFSVRSSQLAVEGIGGEDPASADRELRTAFRELSLPPLPIQYADFAIWQRGWLRGQVLEDQIGYWRAQLGDVEPLELPADRPRPSRPTFRGACQNFAWPQELAEALSKLALGREATLFMVLMSVFQALLFRCSGQRSISVGTPVANRNRAETEDLIGFFVNTLVMRCKLGPELSFEELLSRVRETALAAYAHQDIPFEQVVEALRPDRSLNRTPLFQVMLALQNLPAQGLGTEGGLTISSQPSETIRSRFDLTLFLIEAEGGLQGAAEYSSDLFDATTIQRLLGHLRRLAVEAVRQPQRRLDELSLLSRFERHQLTVEVNDTSRQLPSPATIPALFAQQARQRPDAVALSFTNRSLSYGELERRSRILAGRIGARGAASGSVVGLLAERSWGMVIAILAILRSGAAYLPLDARSPSRRLAAMLDQARVGAVWTHRKLQSILPQGIRTHRLEELPDAALADSASGPPLDPLSLAYVMFTSGSTGDPKGVAVSHRAVVRLVRQTDCARMDADQVFLQLAPISFDASTFELWGALLNGARLALFPPQMPEPELLKEEIARSQITTLWLTAPLFHLMAERQAQGLARLDQLLAGGDVLSPQSVDAVLATGLQRLINGYGPTEGTTFSCCFALRGERRRGTGKMPVSLSLSDRTPEPRVTQASLPVREGSAKSQNHELGTVPIGVPISNTTAYVLDAQQRLLPIGVAGELFIGGDGLARGYFGRPGLTAQRFVPNPFADGSATGSARIPAGSGSASGVPDGKPGPQSPQGCGRSQGSGERLYRSGDRVRWRAEGVLEFLGRQDQQVKLRGFRVEPAEIEAALARHPQVAECALAVRQLKGEKQLVAFVTPTGLHELDPSTLNSFLSRRLPDYMLPAHYIRLDSLPKTSSGKLDRRALPVDSVQGAVEKAERPQTPTEEVLAGIWADVLNAEGPGRQDHFFELGGHSLLATRVAARIRAAFEIELPLRTLFEAPTLLQLARRIDRLREAGSAALPSLQRRPSQGPAPLSYAQQRLWFVDQVTPGTPVYNIPVSLHGTGQFHLPTLQASLEAIVQRHQTLRSRFPQIDGQPVQIVHDQQPIHLPEIDLTALPDAVCDKEQLRLAGLEFGRSFDLSQGPLFRMSLLRLHSDRNALLATLHHIIADGWSLDLLRDELVRLYQAARTERPARLPRLAVQYADYSAWQRELLQGEHLKGQLGYWRNRLAGAAELPLPYDRPAPERPTFQGAEVTFEVPAELADGLRRLSRSQDATLFMTLTAALQLVLGLRYGQHDVSIGTPLANRSRPETQKLIGLFVNTLVLRTRFSDGLTFRQLLRRVRQAALEAYSHQDVPFDKVVEAVQPDRSLTREPLYQVMFSFQGGSRSDSAPQDPKQGVLQAFNPGRQYAQRDLTLTLTDTDVELRGEWTYRCDLFEASAIERLSESYLGILAQAVQSPEIRLGEVEPCTPSERRQQEAQRERHGKSKLESLLKIQSRE